LQKLDTFGKNDLAVYTLCSDEAHLTVPGE
jgi:hypothetical protein